SCRTPAALAPPSHPAACAAHTPAPASYARPTHNTAHALPGSVPRSWPSSFLLAPRRPNGVVDATRFSSTCSPSGGNSQGCPRPRGSDCGSGTSAPQCPDLVSFGPPLLPYRLPSPISSPGVAPSQRCHGGLRSHGRGERLRPGGTDAGPALA